MAFVVSCDTVPTSQNFYSLPWIFNSVQIRDRAYFNLCAELYLKHFFDKIFESYKNSFVFENSLSIYKVQISVEW